MSCPDRCAGATGARAPMASSGAFGHHFIYVGTARLGRCPPASRPHDYSGQELVAIERCAWCGTERCR